MIQKNKPGKPAKNTGIRGMIISLEKSVSSHPPVIKAVVAAAERIISAEVQAFRNQLRADSTVPTSVALRQRLEEICRQELESFRLEHGPFPKDQDQLIAAVSTRITRKIAGSLARESKEGPETKRHRHLTVAG